MEWLNQITTILSIIAAILAWLAKVKWSNEYQSSVEQAIKAKDAQIEQLKSLVEEYRVLTPMKLKEYVRYSNEILSEYNDSIQRQLHEASEELIKSKKEIETLKNQGVMHKKELDCKEKYNTELENKIMKLENQMRIAIESQVSNPSVDHNKHLFITPSDIALYKNIIASSTDLEVLMPDSKYKTEYGPVFTKFQELITELTHEVIDTND